MLKGIDISTFQGVVDFDTLKSVVDFVIIRSSYGSGYTDKQFSRNVSEARRVGLACGFYHYAYPQYNTPETEADWFSKVIGTPKDGEIMCLDFEEAYPDPVGWSKRFLDRLSERLGGYKPLIYLNLNLVNTHNWDTVITGNYGLWLAEWDYNPNGLVPKTPWPTVAFRQYSNHEVIPGIGPVVDANVLYGDFKTFAMYGYGNAIIDDMPDYLKQLLQEKGLDVNNEGQVRAFFGDASDAPHLRTDLENCRKELDIANGKIDTLEKKVEALESQANPVPTTPETPPNTPDNTGDGVLSRFVEFITQTVLKVLGKKQQPQ